MTNKEAIKELSEWLDGCCGGEEIEPTRQALRLAISALQAQEAKTQLSAEGTTSDCISRHAAIEAIYKCTDIYVNNLPIMIDKAETYKAISELPSAQPEPHYCRECKWSRCHINVDKYGNTETYWHCHNWDGGTDEEGYCYEWERRTDGSDFSKSGD